MKKTFDVATGRVLKEIRTKKGISQKDASRKVNKSQNWLSDVENGKTSIFFDDIIKLVEAYEESILDVTKKVDEVLWQLENE